MTRSGDSSDRSGIESGTDWLQQRASTRLVKKYHGRLRSFVQRRFRRELGDHLIDDVVQDSWLRIFEGARTYKSASARGSPWPWMMAIARNAGTDVLRKKAAANLGYQDLSVMDENVEAEVRRIEHAANLQRLREAAEQLDEDLREIVEALLAYGGECSQQELAQRMGLNPNTFRTRLGRARSALRQWRDQND